MPIAIAKLLADNISMLSISLLPSKHLMVDIIKLLIAKLRLAHRSLRPLKSSSRLALSDFKGPPAQTLYHLNLCITVYTGNQHLQRLLSNTRSILMLMVVQFTRLRRQRLPQVLSHHLVEPLLKCMAKHHKDSHSSLIVAIMLTGY